MKRTVRNNITGLPYSLHDMRVTGLAACKNELTLKFAGGFVKLDKERCYQVNGEICFHEVDWDFCYAYVLDFCRNEGEFTGRKQCLADFAAANEALNFEILDETYGYNSSRFSGYLSSGPDLKECTIEIYHLGAMEYIAEK